MLGIVISIALEPFVMSNCSGSRIQESEFRSQKSGVGIRTPAATFEGLGHGEVSELIQHATGSVCAIHSGFWLLASDYLSSYRHEVSRRSVGEVTGLKGKPCAFDPNTPMKNPDDAKLLHDL